MVDCVFYGRKGADNSLGIGDLLLRVQGDIEVDLGRPLLEKACGRSCPDAYSNQDSLVLEVDVSDGELIGEGHCRRVERLQI
jgi:hypothetical protein